MSLSDKIIEIEFGEVIRPDHVKQAVKELKDDLISDRNISQYKHPDAKLIIAIYDDVFKRINKNFGKDLI